MVTSDIEELGILDKLPDLRLLQVLNLVQIGGRKIGAQTPVVARNHHAAPSGGRSLIVVVLGTDTGLRADILERLSVLVFSDSADVDGRVGREDVLRTTGGVLGGSTGDELRRVVLDEIVEDSEVLLLS